MTERLRVCYLVPGHRLVPTAGPTRNVLSLSAELAADADVTVAFCDGLADAPAGVRIREIAPDRASERSGGLNDDAAMRGIGYRAFMRYMRDLRRFIARTTGEFDVVLEKGWLLSGFASARYRSAGVAAIPVENLVQVKSSSATTDLVKGLKQTAGRHLASRHLPDAVRVIAETPALRTALAECHGVPSEKIDVVELGVDPSRFRPRDRAAARARLGIGADRTVLLYVGVLDRIHDLGPLIGGLASAPGATLEVVGDGPSGEDYRRLAEESGVEDRVTFRGRVPHDDVPLWIAAADLCVAPYDPSAFYGGQVAYSTLKIRECLAAGRPVLSVRSGSIPDLVRDGRTGLLVDHRSEDWAALLRSLPDRARLHEMGEAAAAIEPRSWKDVAADYLAVCRSVSVPAPAA